MAHTSGTIARSDAADKNPAKTLPPASRTRRPRAAPQAIARDLIRAQFTVIPQCDNTLTQAIRQFSETRFTALAQRERITLPMDAYIISPTNSRIACVSVLS